MDKHIPLKASELIAALQEAIKKYGDLELIVNTRDGSCYDLCKGKDLYGREIVHPMAFHDKNGTVENYLEIG